MSWYWSVAIAMAFVPVFIVLVVVNFLFVVWFYHVVLNFIGRFFEKLQVPGAKKDK